MTTSRALLLLGSAISMVLTAWASHGSERAGLVDAVRIEKSANRNQVLYGVRVTEDCVPAGHEPVRARWRLYEKPGAPEEPLLDREEFVYGVAHQRVVSRTAASGMVEFAVRALPERPIRVRTYQDGGRCGAVAIVAVQGSAARLERVFIQQGTFFGIDYVMLSGKRLADDRPVSERLRD